MCRETARHHQFLLQRPCTQRHAADRNTFSHQQTQVHVCLCTTQHRQKHHASPHSQRLQVLLHIGCTHKIKHHLHAIAIGQTIHLRSKVLVRKRHIQTQSLSPFQLTRCP